MPISFRPAVRSGVKLMVGIAGPSGSGKTMSALEIAEGIRAVEGGEIFVIDTESRRAAHYAGDGTRGTYRFMHGDLEAPFTPAAYLEAIEAAVKAGAKVVVIDSMSHEHEGPGGILEMHDEAVNRMAGENANFARREAVKFAAWIEPKRRHNLFVNRVLQIDAHFIFCFRAKDKLKMVKNDRGKNEPVSAGWQPIVADRFEYEMTTLLVLPPGAKGKPDLNAEATKLPEPIAPLVRDGAQLSRGFGRALAEWARGGAPATNTNAAAGSSPGASQREPSGAPASSPPAEGSRLARYHRELSPARDRDDLGGVHDGWRDQWAGADQAEKDAAAAVFRLHQKRVAGTIALDAFEDEAARLIGAPAGERRAA